MKDICPRCQTKMTDTVSLLESGGGLPVKGCSNCGGFIADYSGAEQLIQGSGNMQSSKEIKSSGVSVNAHKELSGNCPVCEGKFEAIPLNFELTDETIYLDQCAECGGIWFDKGELMEIFNNAVKEAMAVGEFTENFDSISDSKDTYLDCPRCNIKRTAYEGKILDMQVVKCKACNGIWISDGQLGELMGDVKSLEVTPKAAENIKGETQVPTHGSCPKCKVKLEKWENMPSSIKDLYVDYCPKCNGLWFDKGEFRSFFKIFGESPFQAE